MKSVEKYLASDGALLLCDAFVIHRTTSNGGIAIRYDNIECAEMIPIEEQRALIRVTWTGGVADVEFNPLENESGLWDAYYGLVERLDPSYKSNL